MKREKEFKEYLEKNKITTKNVGYCRDHIEKAFGGKDMDEIIVKHQNISMVHDNLKALGEPDSSINAYMVALNHYLKFAFTFSGLVESASNPKKIDSFAGSIVQYYHNVPVVERDESLRRALESEYPKILQFARNVFDVDYGYIPVYLSKKKPSSKYKLTKRFLEELNERRQEQREMRDKERRLIDDILENGCYKFDIVATFFPGEKPYVEIYYKNLPTEYRLEAAMNYLAHEYMHFMEYAYCVENFARAFEDVRDSEALADFFGALYSINRGSSYDLSVAKDRYTLWNVLQGSGWPYAYALYFYTVKGKKMKFSSNFVDYTNHGSINKLIEVFNATKNSADAYDKLIKL